MTINIDEELEKIRINERLMKFCVAVHDRINKYGIWAAISEESVIRLQSKDWSNWLQNNKGKVYYVGVGFTSPKAQYIIVMTTDGFLTDTTVACINKPVCHFLSEMEKEYYQNGTYLEEYKDKRCTKYATIIGLPVNKPDFNELYKQKMEEKKMKNKTCQFKVMWKGTATILFRDGRRVSVAKVHGEEFDKTKGLLMCIWKMKFTHSYMKSTLKRRNLEGSQDAELAILYERAYMISHLDDDSIKRIVKSAKEDKKLNCWYAEF